MKANELMVGDYVNVSPSMMTIKVESVIYKRVRYRSCTGRVITVSEGLIVHIPLTPKILERNGFSLIDKADKIYRLEFADGVYIQVDFKADEPYVYVSNRCYFASPYCNAVHHLQHALKLCGIEKEIEL